MALALDVGSRLWLATAVARIRDGLLVHLLLRRTLAALAGRAFLLAVDGFAGYVTAARSLVRVPRRTGRRGRPSLVWPEGFALTQVVKAGLQRGEGIVRRVVVGTAATVAAALAASHGGATINTAYIERLNATLRERVAPLVRRRRAPAGPSSSRAGCPSCAWHTIGAGPRVPAPARPRHGLALAGAHSGAGRWPR